MNRLLLAAWLAWPVPALAQDTFPLSLSVSAGKHDRSQTPVKVAVAIPLSLRGALIVPLKTDDGRTFYGQLSRAGIIDEELRDQPEMVGRYLHFILPELPVGKTLTLQGTVTLDVQQPSEVFHWKDSPGRFAELSLGDRPILRYMCAPLDESSAERRAETYKPYHHVYDPQGKFFITKGPGGLYPHHRGLFFGFNRIRYDDGNRAADTWHCNRGESQQHAAFLRSETGPVFGRHEVQINWHGQDKNVFARERRQVAAYNVGGGLLFEFASCLETIVGPLVLDGDPQHAGFQFRATQEVPDTTRRLTYYLRPDGKGEPGLFRNWDATTRDPRTVNLPWLAMSFVVGNRRYTCCYLDRPENPKEARYSERDYGRFGSYFEYEVTSDRPLRVGYRIWLQEGEMTVDQVQRLASDFSDPPQARVQPAAANP
jgi:hypothetical protein